MVNNMKDITTDRELDENSIKKLLRIVELEKESEKELKECEKKFGAIDVRTVLLRRIYKGYNEILENYK